MTYIGRFAPSPTGSLHYGSLLAALVSYLDAKHHQGQWLLRIDDIDTPRVVAGADTHIIATLKSHGLQWDQDIVYQSTQYSRYRAALQTLDSRQQTYACSCSRARLKNNVYDGYCQHKPVLAHAPSAIRLKTTNAHITYDDLWLGTQHCNIQTECGDFVIWRKDNLCAYQLAVVVDDHAAGVTHIIRGSDLSHSSPRQILLHQALAYPVPVYGHFPVLVNTHNEKLSKQHAAAPVDNDSPINNLRTLLSLLGQAEAPSHYAQVSSLIKFATEHWRRDALPKQNIPWLGDFV